MGKIIIGNWKANMNEKTTTSFASSMGKQLSKNKTNNEWIVFPPSILIPYFSTEIKKFDNFNNKNIGAQNFFSKENGPFTGEISLAILKKMGIKYLLIGHIERRNYFNETSEIINRKLIDALSMGFTPIYIFGEDKKIKKDADLNEKIKDQLTLELKGITREQAKKILFTYLANSKVSGMFGVKDSGLRKIYNIVLLNVRKAANLEPSEITFLYGGAITKSNYKDLLNLPFLNGLLIEELALDVREFTKIIKYTGTN